MKKAIAISFLSLFSIHCAYTSLTSVKNPSLIDKKYERLLVIAPFEDIQYQKLAEDEFINIFYSIKVDAFSGLQIIPPIKKYSDDEINSIFDKYQIDGILVIALTDFYTSETFIPQSSSTSGSATLIGNYLMYSQKTQTYGGFSVSKPRVKFDIRLYDRKSGEIAWLSHSLTRGNAYADFYTLAYSLAQATVYKLATQDKMLIKSRFRK